MIGILSCEKRDDGSKKVRPDIDGLIMQGGYAPRGTGVRIGSGSIARCNVVVVPLPRGKVIPKERQSLFGPLLGFVHDIVLFLFR